MIIEQSISQQLLNYLGNGAANYSQSLSYLWTLKQYTIIQKRSGNKYTIGFLDKLQNNTMKWITTEPARSIIRLRKLNRCSYCNVELFDKNGDGDHIVGKSLDGALWQVPCCHTIISNCNSSKGGKDLLDWWMKKGRNINDLKTDVLSIYLRAKWRVLQKTGLLYSEASKSHHYFILQLWNS